MHLPSNLLSNALIAFSIEKTISFSFSKFLFVFPMEKAIIAFDGRFDGRCITILLFSNRLSKLKPPLKLQKFQNENFQTKFYEQVIASQKKIRITRAGNNINTWRLETPGIAMHLLLNLLSNVLKKETSIFTLKKRIVCIAILLFSNHFSKLKPPLKLQKFQSKNFWVKFYDACEC